MKRRVAALAAAAFFALPAMARAESDSADAAELFAQGRAALAAKDYETACKKLEASNRLERAVGTLISLAQCTEGLDRLASARAYWKEAADLAKAVKDPLNREEYAAKRFDEIDARVPRLVVEPAAGAPAHMRISRDGIALDAAAYGVPLPVDPGPHVLRAEADGHDGRVVSVDLAEGETKAITLEPGPRASSSPLPADEQAREEPRPPPARGQRTLAVVVGGAGVVGIGVGAVTGLVAPSKWSSAKRECGTECAADHPAVAQKDAAEAFATVSTVAFVAGGAMLAAGAVLWLTASKSGRAVALSPAIGHREASLGVAGRF
jgi:hypothetical protein